MNLYTCNNSAQTSVRVLQDPIIIKYFLFIIYIVKLLRAFLIAHFITIADIIITIVIMTFAFNTCDNLAKISIEVL